MADKNNTETQESDARGMTSKFDLSVKHIWEEKVAWSHPFHPDIKLVVRMHTMHFDENSVPEYLEDDAAIFEIAYCSISLFGHNHERILASLHPMPERNSIINYTIQKLINYFNDPAVCLVCLEKMIHTHEGYICRCSF